MTIKKPRGWKSDPKLREAYEEGGRGVGRQLLHDKSMEPKLWALLSGTGVWPRWYLSAFRSLYIKENPKEYRNWRRRRERARGRAKKYATMLGNPLERASSRLSDDCNVLPPDGIDA